MTVNRSIISTTTLTIILAGLVLSTFVPLSASADTTDRLSASERRANQMKRKSETSTSTNASTTVATSTKAVDRTCMQTAVDTREEAIMTSFRVFASSTLAAMAKRQTAFASVWTDTTIKNPSKYNAIWKTWKKDTDKARKQLNKSRVEAWKTFRTTAKESCKATLPKSESETQETGGPAI